MTELLNRAISRAQDISPEMQDEIARIVLAFAGDEQKVFELTPADEEAVLRSRDAAAKGDFASDEERQAVWAKFGL